MSAAASNGRHKPLSARFRGLKPTTKKVTFYIASDLHAELKSMSESWDVPMSAIVNMAMFDFCSKVVEEAAEGYQKPAWDDSEDD